MHVNTLDFCETGQRLHSQYTKLKCILHIFTYQMNMIYYYKQISFISYQVFIQYPPCALMSQRTKYFESWSSGGTAGHLFIAGLVCP